MRIFVMKNLYRYLKYLFVFLFLLIFSSCDRKSNPAVQNGILNLRNTDPSHFLVDLSGTWNFVWGKYSQPNETVNWEKISVPGNWMDKKSSENPSAIGIGSYHLKALLPPSDTELYMIVYGSRYAFDLYLNQQKIIHAGNNSSSIENFIVSQRNYIITLPKETEVDIVLHISNQINLKSGGIYRSFKIGDKDSIFSNLFKELFINIISIGIQFFIFIFHLSIYIINKKRERISLFFSIASLFMTIWTIFSSSQILNYIFPNFNDYYSIKIGYFSLHTAALFYMYYIYYLYENEFYKPFLNIYLFFYLVIFVFDLFNYDLRLIYYLNMLSNLYGILILSSLAFFCKNIYIRKPEGWNLFLFSIVIVIITGIFDIAMGIFDYSFTPMIGLGILIFNFMHTFIANSRTNRTIQWAEIKSEVLQTKVEIRSIELQKQKDTAEKSQKELQATLTQLIQSEKMATLGTLVAGVAHEINTPLGAIKASAENINDVVQELEKKLDPDFNQFTTSDWKLILQILPECGKSNKNLSTKEARGIKKNLIKSLEEKNLNSPENIADSLMSLGLYEGSGKLEELFENPKYELVLNFLFILDGIKTKSNIIGNSTTRVSKIVKSLKSFTHFDQSGDKSLADIRDGLETVLTIYHNSTKHGIEVIKNYEEIPLINCFPDELNQVWSNLIHNSIQAMKGNGQITIDVKLVNNGQTLSVSIEDTGPGIPPEIQEKIFEPFFTTKPVGEGSGLGLHIIKKILEKHNGVLQLFTEPGKTRFTVLIPIEKEQPSYG